MKNLGSKCRWEIHFLVLFKCWNGQNTRSAPFVRKLLFPVPLLCTNKCQARDIKDITWPRGDTKFVFGEVMFYLLYKHQSNTKPFHLLVNSSLLRTLLVEAFPLCFSALYCHSLRSFGCSRFVLVVSVPRKRTLQTAVWDSCWACVLDTSKI